MQLADVSEMKANIYVPEFSMRDIRVGESVRLLVSGRIIPLSGVVGRLSPVSALVADGLISKEQLQGINPPRYYLGTVILRNDGGLMPGMSGSAKILVGKRSLAGFCLRFSRDLLDRKIW
jgi:hypothetical protein